MVNNEILEQGQSACYQGQHGNGELGKLLYSLPLCEKRQEGSQTPRTADERGRTQASESGEHHDPLQGRVGPDTVTWRSCNQTSDRRAQKKVALKLTDSVFCLLRVPSLADRHRRV